MPGLIVDGDVVDIPTLRCLSWLDEPELRLRLPNDGTRRRPQDVPHSIVLHTTRGDWPQHVIGEDATEAECTARRTVRYWQKSDKRAGSHLIVDADGSVLCLADIVREVSYHCPGVNGVSVGIEVTQRDDGGIWQAQLTSVYAVVDKLAGLLGIERRVAWPYSGARSTMEMRRFRGVFGHRDASENRGRGDPGDELMQLFVRAGWEAVK